MRTCLGVSLFTNHTVCGTKKSVAKAFFRESFQVSVRHVENWNHHQEKRIPKIQIWALKGHLKNTQGDRQPGSSLVARFLAAGWGLPCLDAL